MENHKWLKQMVNYLTKASTVKQVTVGGLTGWCAGHLFVKVSHLASIALGWSLLVIVVAHHTGYIAINWSQLEHKVSQTRREIENEANHALPWLATEVQEFVQENFFLSGAFAGGFLVGMAT